MLLNIRTVIDRSNSVLPILLPRLASTIFNLRPCKNLQNPRNNLIFKTARRDINRRVSINHGVLWAKKDGEKGRVNPSPVAVGFEHADEDPAAKGRRGMEGRRTVGGGQGGRKVN